MITIPKPNIAVHKILTFILLLVTHSIFAQDSTYIPVTYTNVVKVDSLIHAKELYIRARSWFATAYNSAKNTVQLDDKDSGKVISNGVMNYSSTLLIGASSVSGRIMYTLTILIKDGRYKWEFTNFTHEAESPKGYSFGIITKSYNCPYTVDPGISKHWKNSVWDDIKETIVTKTQATLNSLKDVMNQPADKSADW